MIAHSLDHPGFGAASQLHGATYIVDASFFSPVLNEMNVVLDIALAAELLKKILMELNYKNLDAVDKLKGKITTTEFLCQYIHEELSREVVGFFCRRPSRRIRRIPYCMGFLSGRGEADMIYFVCPDPTLSITGGNIFNQQIIDGLNTLRIPFTQIIIDTWKNLDPTREDIILMDSIYLDELPALNLNKVEAVKLILVHLLPSMVDKSRALDSEKEILSQFDLLIANSLFTRDYLFAMNLPQPRIKIIQPWIRKLQNTGEFKRNKIILVANWYPAKQIDKFFEQLLLSRLPDDLLVYFYGDTQVDKRYTRHCMSILEDNPSILRHISIEGISTRENLDKVYAESKCLVDVSGFESYGMAVAEAIVSDLQVLTLGNGHVAELSSQGRCMRCNSMDSLVDNLIGIHRNELVIKLKPIHDIIDDWEKFIEQMVLVFGTVDIH